jgi:hypothetical protein
VKKKQYRKHWRRRKGKKLQNYVQSLVLKTFPHLKKKDVNVAGNGVNGPDIILSTVAKKLCPYLFETKNQNKMKTIYDFYNQAHKNAGPLEPAVIMKMNAREPLVVIDVKHFFKLIKP